MKKSDILEAFSKVKDSPDPTCPYCGRHAAMVKGREIYPHRQDLQDLNFWRCTPCDAHVGCHTRNGILGLEGTEPLGRLANADLRKAKSAAHRAFDPLWQNGVMTRFEAYRKLAETMSIPLCDCHIGQFDIEECQRVIAFADEFGNNETKTERP